MPFGFLKRRQSEAPSAHGAGWAGTPTASARRGEVALELTMTYFTRIRHDASVAVVGESYRQELVARARTPSADDLPPGIPAPPPGLYKAALVPEPTNPYDANAISVLLWASRTWVLSGYLSRTDAVLYQPLFRHLGRDGGRPAIACDAALVAEGSGRGVVLHLGTPGECMVELITDDRVPAAHPWTGQAVAITGRSRSTITGVLLDREAQVMLATWAGCTIVPRVTKKTQALIAAEPRDATGNTQKARDYGIPIVDEVEFLRTIGLPPEAIGRDELAWARQ
jgi:hypothetical protein